MIHFMHKDETDRTRHTMSTGCNCRPKLRGLYQGTWKNMVGLALDHQPPEPVRVT